MARFTNIGMPRKTFVASAAEEAQTKTARPDEESQPAESKKRKGWGRDPEIAKQARLTGERSEQRRLHRQHERSATTTCFACRGLGHAAAECPNILLAATGQSGSAALLEADDMAKRQSEATTESDSKGKEGKGKGKGKGEKTGSQLTGGKCYRCNSVKHPLSRCPKRVDPENPTPFATCFVCLGEGHLASACPQNPKGVYVNGGNCKVCGSVKHRASDCPDDKRGKEPMRPRGEIVLGTGDGAGADEDDFIAMRHEQRGDRGQGKRPRHEPAKNSARGPAKQPGEEGAFAPAPPPAAAAPPVKKKAKVVKF